MKILIYTVLLYTFEYSIHVSGKNVLAVENPNKPHFEFGHANADHSLMINNNPDENKCKEKCGDSNGVLCKGDPCDINKITCSCSDENYTFVSKEEGCRVNKCKLECGNSTGVRCKQDSFDKRKIFCSCSDQGYTFLSKEKGCRANKCTETCGYFREVICEGDEYGDDQINCSCSGKGYRFMSKNRGCVANKCEENCGHGPGVICKGDPYGENYVGCVCLNEDYVFVSKEEGCKACRCQNGDCVEKNGKYDCVCKPGYGMFEEKCFSCDCGEDIKCSFEGYNFVTKKKCFCLEGQKEVNNKCIDNKCIEKCGDSNGVVCKGDPYGEDYVTCTCSDENYMFVSKEEGCRVNKCKAKCGNSIGVRCARDPQDEEEVVCLCSDYGYVFMSKEKGCQECYCGKGMNCTFKGNSLDTKTCLCPKGYEEVNGKCENLCTGILCKNGGICQIENNKQICYCKSPYSGDFCEKKESSQSRTDGSL